MPQLNNLCLEIAYLGTEFYGSQIQKNGITIQEHLDRALLKVYGQKIKSSFAGRTDSGVHSIGQRVSIMAPQTVPWAALPKVLNRELAPNIAVTKLEVVNQQFHARYSALSREYIYNILYAPYLPLYLKDLVWFIDSNQTELNLTKLCRAAKLLSGCKDFALFCAAGSEVESTVRRVSKSKFSKGQIAPWPGSRDQKLTLLSYHIKADGFLYHMVRNIVGFLVEVGRGKLKAEPVLNNLENLKRPDLKFKTAPACGLVLSKVTY